MGSPIQIGGRISDVKTKKPRYDGVLAASNDETTEFMALARKPTSLSGTSIEPLSSSKLASLFTLRQGGSGCLDLTETDQIECKESFGGQHWVTNSIKAIAAFANNRGGYIAFGVKENSWEVVGIKKHETDSGLRGGMTTVEWDRIKELERENRQLRQANEILKKAFAYFTQAELDRPFRK